MPKAKDAYDYPPEERPYIQGYNAGIVWVASGKLPNDVITANPHDRGTKFAEQWDQGFEDGTGDQEAYHEQFHNDAGIGYSVPSRNDLNLDDYLFPGWA